METALVDFLIQTVTIETVASVDVANNKTYNDPVNYKCRIQQLQTDLRSGVIETREASGTVIYLDGNVDVTSNDRITLPAPYNPTQPRIMRVEKMPDFEELGTVYYTKIVCE